MSRLPGISIEPLEPRGATRALSCGALPGRPFTVRGAIVWRDPHAVAFELWQEDGHHRAALYRPASAAPVTLHRAGETIEVPAETPVQVLDLDEISFERRRIRLHLDQGEARAGGPAQVAATLEMPQLPEMLDQLVRTPPPQRLDGPPTGVASRGVLVVTLLEAEETRQLEFEHAVTLGSADDNDLVLKGPGVEQHHARIEPPTHGRVSITHLGREGATLLNGAPIRGTAQVREDDMIRVGGCVLTVRFRPADRGGG